MQQSKSGASIKVDAVERSFPESGLVIDHVSFQIRAGEFVVFLGPSGCGKSTLLRLIAGLDVAHSGVIETEAAQAEFFRSFVFQEAQLLPWRTVLENVTLPLQLMKKDNVEAQARAALEKVGLTDALHKYPNQLSGGMKMRVSVARALVSKPKLLLLDEPFAALDERSRHQLQGDLRHLWLQLGMTVIFVTHSVTEAVFLADRALLFSSRPAKLLLDHHIALGEERGQDLRRENRFQDEVGLLGRALAVECGDFRK